MDAKSEILVVVGSKNPVKVNAAREAFERAFPDAICRVEGVSVGSGVSDQPMSDEETREGALNRAQAIRQIDAYADCDYAVGIEGGITTIDGEFFAAAWIVILDRAGNVAKSRSGTFALPPAVQRLVEEGHELGIANDRVFGEVNSKHAGGAVGSLTGGRIGRQDLYEHAMILALIYFTQSQLFQVDESQ